MDGRTDRRTPHDGIGGAYAQHRETKTASEGLSRTLLDREFQTTGAE